MPLSDDTQSYQEALAAICRSGVLREIPGVSSERAEVYRGLIRNGVEDALRHAYPLCSKLLKGKALSNGLNLWRVLVDDFLEHRALQSAELWRMPKELLPFVREKHYARLLEAPYLEELLEFEWIEVELYMMNDLQPTPFTSQGRLLEDKLVLNPEHALRNFKYPVFKTPVPELEEEPAGDYYLASYRVPNSGEVRFTEVSSILFKILSELSLRPASVRYLLELHAPELVEKLGAQKNIHEDLKQSEGALRQLSMFLTTAINEGLILGYAADS